MPERDSNTPRIGREPSESGGADFLRAYVEEPSLRMVLIAGVGILVTFATWMVANAVRMRSVGAIAVLVLVALASAEGVRADFRRGGRPGSLSGLIATLWVLTALASWAALRWDLL